MFKNNEKNDTMTRMLTFHRQFYCGSDKNETLQCLRKLSRQHMLEDGMLDTLINFKRKELFISFCQFGK